MFGAPGYDILGLMSFQLFSDAKVKVEYTAKFALTEDSTVKKYGSKATSIINAVKKDALWSFDGEVDKKKKQLTRIKGINYPKVNNGHQATEGWCWQLDADTKGTSSQDRLVLACKPGDVGISQKESGTVKVGTEMYTLVKAEITVKGSFRTISKSHKRG